MKKTEEKIEQCEKLLAELKAELLNQKPVFKVGDWIYWKGHRPTYARLERKSGGCWVLNIFGNITSHNSCSETHLRLATTEEIKAHLIKEAEKRGYKEGVKIKPLWETPLDYWMIGDISDIRYSIDTDAFCYGVHIYREGKWAEIIKEEIILTLDGVDYSKSTLRSLIKKATS